MPHITYLALVLLLVPLAIRHDTPTATTPCRAWADLRTAGWKRIARTVLLVAAGLTALVILTVVRTGVYGAAVGVAALACGVASLVAVDRRPVRVRRTEVGA